MFDPEENVRDDAEAARRFPGPDYYEVLRLLHAMLRPSSYVEIGVLHGSSLRLAAHCAVALGIDPHPPENVDWPPSTRVLAASSDEFFGAYDLREVLGVAVFDFALIDGAHLFEQVAADFSNLERFAGTRSVIAIHDTIPLDERTSSRCRSTEFYTGDVWKMLPLLASARPRLRVATILTAPSGLTLVAGFGAPTPALDPRPFVGLDWRDFESLRTECVAPVRNSPGAIAAWLHDLRQ